MVCVARLHAAGEEGCPAQQTVMLQVEGGRVATPSMGASLSATGWSRNTHTHTHKKTNPIHCRQSSHLQILHNTLIHLEREAEPSTVVLHPVQTGLSSSVAFAVTGLKKTKICSGTHGPVWGGRKLPPKAIPWCDMAQVT